MNQKSQPNLYLAIFTLFATLIFLTTRALPITTTPPLTLTTITPTATLTPTALTSTPSATIEPTVDPLFFREDFDGFLEPGWQWVNEDPSQWNLDAVPGALQINLSSGRAYAGTTQNMLLRPAPSGDFQVTTGFSFRASDNYQFAGLILYESATNFLQIGRSYCRGASFECVGSGIYMQFYENQIPASPSFAIPYSDDTYLHLRLTRMGNEYTLDASADGMAWYHFGNYTINFKPNYIGLLAGQNLGQPATALFDYFEVSSVK